MPYEKNNVIHVHVGDEIFQAFSVLFLLYCATAKNVIFLSNLLRHAIVVYSNNAMVSNKFT